MKTKKLKLEKLKIVCFKANAKDRALIMQMAKKYAKGGLSAWIRHASLKYVPKKGELIKAYPAPPRTIKVKKSKKK